MWPRVRSRVRVNGLLEDLRSVPFVRARRSAMLARLPSGEAELATRGAGEARRAIEHRQRDQRGGEPEERARQRPARLRGPGEGAPPDDREVQHDREERLEGRGDDEDAEPG